MGTYQVTEIVSSNLEVDRPDENWKCVLVGSISTMGVMTDRTWLSFNGQYFENRKGYFQKDAAIAEFSDIYSDEVIKRLVTYQDKNEWKRYHAKFIGRRRLQWSKDQGQKYAKDHGQKTGGGNQSKWNG